MLRIVLPAEIHRTMRQLCTLLPSLLLSSAALAQYTPPDPSGLEGIVVERYYVSDANDASDTDGSTDLGVGEVTYRVFVDLKPGYKLITVGGFPDHEISFNTTTSFFYNDDRGESWGGNINDIHLNKNTVAIDSWLSAGASTDGYWGVMKNEDTDGSVFGANDGGSTGTPLLVNNDASIGLPLTTADGLLVGTPPGILSVGTAPTIFNDAGGATYSSSNFAWSSSIGNVEGPTASNKLLVGQFTTDGVLSYCLNVWLRIPDSLVCSDPNCHEILEYYAVINPADTSGGGFNSDNKFSLPSLCYNSSSQQLDCLGVPGGPAVSGTACDDGNTDTQNDVYDNACACVGEDCLGVLGGAALPGQPCDDNNASTVNDTWQTGCLCTGIVGIGEVVKPAIQVEAHPNPTRDLIWITMAGIDGKRIGYTLRNALGQAMVTKDLGAQGSTWKGTLDLSGLSTGVYFLEVVGNDQRSTKRITKF